MIMGRRRLLRLSLYMRSVPILPEPKIATAVFSITLPRSERSSEQPLRNVRSFQCLSHMQEYFIVPPRLMAIAPPPCP